MPSRCPKPPDNFPSYLMNKIEITHQECHHQFPASSQQRDLYPHPFLPPPVLPPKSQGPRIQSFILDPILLGPCSRQVAPPHSFSLSFAFILFFKQSQKPFFLMTNRYLAKLVGGKNTQIVLGTKIVSITTIDIFKSTKL